MRSTPPAHQLQLLLSTSGAVIGSFALCDHGLALECGCEAHSNSLMGNECAVKPWNPSVSCRRLISISAVQCSAGKAARSPCCGRMRQRYNSRGAAGAHHHEGAG